MSCLPPEITGRIVEYTPAGVIQRHLDALNLEVQAASTMRLFRPLTLASLLDRAVRLYTGSGMGFFQLHDFLVLWLTNNGVAWDFHQKQRRTEALAIAVNDWFRVSGLQ